MRLKRLRLAFHLEGSSLLGLDRIANEPTRPTSDQRLAGRRRLLEPRGDVDRVACDKRLSLAGDDLAGVDADADTELERPRGGMHLGGCAHCAKRIVLMRLRHAEHGHHRVADELLHRAAVPLDDGPHLLVVATHQSPQGLRVYTLAERGRADDVAEQHGDGLSHLARRPCLGKSGAAGGAEAEAFGVLRAAAWAGGHLTRVTRPAVPVPLSAGLWHNGVFSGVASSRSILARRTRSSSFAAAGLPSSSLRSSRSTR